MTPLSIEHQNLGRFLLSLTSHFADSHQLGVVAYDPFQMKTAPELPSRAPDIMFVANEKFVPFGRDVSKWSPQIWWWKLLATEAVERIEATKFYEYEEGGVCEYWLIDPQRHQAEFYLRGEDGIYCLAPISEDGIFPQHCTEGFVAKDRLALERINAVSFGGIKGVGVGLAGTSFVQALTYASRFTNLP